MILNISIYLKVVSVVVFFMISRAVKFNFLFFRASLVFCMFSSFAQFGYSWDWKWWCGETIASYFNNCKTKPADTSHQPSYTCSGFVKGSCSEKKCIGAIGHNCITAEDVASDVIDARDTQVCDKGYKYLKVHSDKLHNRSTECYGPTKKYSVTFIEPDKTSQTVSSTHGSSFVSGTSSVQLSPSSTFPSPVGSTSSQYQGALNGNNTVHFSGVSSTKTPSLESSSVNLQSEIVVSPTQKGHSSSYSIATLSSIATTVGKVYAFLTSSAAQLPAAPTNGTYPYPIEVISSSMHDGSIAMDDDDDGLLPVKIILPILGAASIVGLAVVDRYCLKNKLWNIFKNNVCCCFSSDSSAKPDEPTQFYNLDGLETVPLNKYDANVEGQDPQFVADPFNKSPKGQLTDLEAQ